jgi:6-phosphogluconolactonase
MKGTIHIFPTPDALAEAAAERFVTAAMAAVTGHGRFLVALSGGGTPQALYRLLAGPPYREQVPWGQTHLFWGDERCVPPADPGSNYGAVEKNLIRHVMVAPENVHRIKGELGPTVAAADYSTQLHHFAEEELPWPRFDLVLLGLGEDGHTAALFPGHTVQAPAAVVPVTADYQDRPAQRVTLTPAVFNTAHHILFLVTGGNKAEAVAAVQQGPADPRRWPAQQIQPEPGTLTWFIDEAAAARLTG